MNAPNADLYIVRDIAPVVESGTWRWALQHPELRFFLEQTAGLRFSLDLAVPEITFRHTGPVTISIRINGHPFQEVHCDEPGSRQFVWPVPSSLLMAGAINTVLFQPDKVWASPEDGTALGFILTEAGFLQ
jgi:hypothetical protein